MPKYRVYYKYYYHEHSEFSHTDVIADNSRRALQAFFRRIRAFAHEMEFDEPGIPDLRRVRPGGDYSWREGDWLASYRGIDEVDAIACPTCEGHGEVPSAVAQRLTSIKP